RSDARTSLFSISLPGEKGRHCSPVSYLLHLVFFISQKRACGACGRVVCVQGPCGKRAVAFGVFHRSGALTGTTVGHSHESVFPPGGEDAFPSDFRRDGPPSVTRCARWTTRSRMASARVGSPRYSCQRSVGS